MADDADRWASVGVPQLGVKTFSGVGSMALSFLAWTRFARVTRFAKRFAPDVVYYPGGHAWKPLLGLLMPRSAVTVLTIHDPQLHSGEDSLPQRIFSAANRMGTHGYVLLNESQRASFVEQNGLDFRDVAVVPHGIFDDVIDLKEPLANIESLADLAPIEGRYALFVGRIHPYKGLPTLLRAYQDLPVEIPLVIAGSGEFSAEETAALAALADRPVHVVNRWLSDAEISSLVGAARFVVLPYEPSATQSGVIPLASAYGVPSIASRAGGLAEQVVDGSTGFLHESGDANALRELLVAAFGMDDAEYAAMSQRCREFARDNWEWSALGAQLVAFFEELLARK